MKGRLDFLALFACFAVGNLLLLLPLKSLAQKPESFILAPENLYNLNYTDSLEYSLQLEGLQLDLKQQQFINEQIAGIESPAENGAWLAFELRNNLNIARFLYLRFCPKADTVLLFSFLPNSLATLSSTSAQEAPSKRIVFSPTIYLPVSVPPQDASLFVAYLRFPQDDLDPHFSEIFISTAQSINQEYQERARFQFFFAGFMLLLSLIALVASVILRNRSLAYYALLMPFFVVYFHQQTNMNAYIIEWLPWLKGYQQGNLAILFEILFGFLFISEYLNLKKNLPRLYGIFGVITFLNLISLIVILFTLPGVWINIVLITWLLTSLGIAIYLSVKGDKSAKILLLSFGALILGAIFYALKVSGVLVSFEFAAYAFQIGTLIFSLILFYALALRVNTIRMEKLKAEGLSKMKSDFFQDISHELRTPLSLVIDPVERVLKDLPAGNNKEMLSTAHEASRGLLNLVNQILDLSKLESVPLDLNLEPINISSHVEVLLGSFRSMADDKGVLLEFHSDCKDIVMGVDTLRLQQIVNNLLSNALKFTPAGGKVSLRLKQESEGFVELSVQDSGSGISEKSLPHIFNRYFQASENKNSVSAAGTGIGLALTKVLVEQHKGSIWVRSKVGEGSCFTFSLATDLLPADEWEIQEESKNFVLEMDQEDQLRQLVLVIEDHPQLRTYLLEQLSEHYRVLEAADGEAGLALAQEHMPDIVISDLMMPLLDGYEITKSLKGDARTSHIPVILLTAKASQDAKNKGLEMGADDYLLKPFNSKELLLRIANLLKLKDEWRKSIKGEELPQIKATLLSKVDREFLNRLDQALVENYKNANYSVQDLAQATAMSKTHLNRKLNALLELSASKLIQNYRLKRAKSLLEAKEGNVSEIALLCGFNSTTYFVKCFKEKYGLTPGSFL